ncbi:RES family NAD+ phosphorylase [Dyadobacter sp. CY323]|uniref:RES family NAD+ phosphorylase n=1 Tax=Dyadobacter sp. CY323 TaxID=2907302 RepID=UPI001F18CEFC|nr:RES family NAD+ phosphorylase [Dyadobacter sp. CY323]MCE6992976.1 RES family NAD+ phosphorylase [Dyadobacter sp. CY323]
MLVYRITSRRYSADLHGTGCLYAAGRWHFKGTQILYTSEHISLSKLEVLANSIVTPQNQVLVTLELPEVGIIKEIDIKDLPADCWRFPYPDSLARVTEQWLDGSTSWLMKVPSAHSFNEFNYLLNPFHELHRTIRIIDVENIHFDARLK